MRLAWRNLLRNKTRFGLSVAGVALAVMLVLILNGFLSGMNAQIGAYLSHEPGTLVVAQDGVQNLLGVASQLPPGTASVVKSRGAAQVIPILSQSVIFEMHSQKQIAYLVGYDPQVGGGPWQLAAGREPRNDREIVFDRVLAARHQLDLKDRVKILDRDLTIVGLAEGTNSWMTGMVFVRKRAAEILLRAPGATSFLLVSPTPRVPSAELQRRLESLGGVNVLSKDDVIGNDVKLFSKVLAAPIQLMAAIAFLVGTMMVGMVIYTATVERQREYGMLKAIGAPNRLLFQVVTLQALVASGAGALLGIGGALGASWLIMQLRPQFLITLEPSALLQALGVGFAMALGAALVPTRTISQLTPAEVFRK